MSYSHTGSHIRAKVFRDRHRKTWALEVINTSTGEVVATDDCVVYETIADLAVEAVGVYRAAWFWGIRRRDVRK